MLQPLTGDTAIKKSVWLIRRAAVLEDGMTHSMINPIHISEKDMVADPLTKYLPTVQRLVSSHALLAE